MTITLHWWLIPTWMIAASAILIWIGSNEKGMFGGVRHFLVSGGLFIGAICAFIVGWIK